MVMDPSQSTPEPTLYMLLLILEAWFHEACACLLGIVLPSAGLAGHLSVASLPRAMIAEAPVHWLAHARQRCLDHCIAISEPARREALASPGFVFEDVDFPLLAIESIERRMAWVDAEPVRAFDEEVMLPLAIHLEATFRSTAATRAFFPVVEPLVSDRGGAYKHDQADFFRRLLARGCQSDFAPSRVPRDASGRAQVRICISPFPFPPCFLLLSPLVLVSRIQRAQADVLRDARVQSAFTQIIGINRPLHLSSSSRGLPTGHEPCVSGTVCNPCCLLLSSYAECR